MKTRTRRPRRITIRGTQDGYRVSGMARTFPSHHSAFNAAWRECRRTGADLYAMTPDGQRILSLDGKSIQAYRRGR